uniref:CLIP domain-containing serine protease n=1 Tax=Anopheles atroparvus TaxID=41427 RepID=A0AAG5CUB7_ANOAO
MPSRITCTLACWMLVIANVLMCMLFQTTEAQYLTQCRTPEQSAGSCVTVTQCPLVQNLLKKPLLTANDVQYLENSRCGVLNRKALVCCARPVIATNAATQAPSPVPSLVPTNIVPVDNRLESLEQRQRLLPDECGLHLSDRIIGGERAKLDEYPWMALLQHRRKTGALKFHCGGALISTRYVLTAAHCIRNIPSTWILTIVRLGETDLQTNPDCTTLLDETTCADPVQDIAFEKIIVHPEYRAIGTEVRNDIAQIRLAQDAQLNDYVHPICLPLDNAARTQSYDGQRLVVAGWGQTEEDPLSQYKLFVGVDGVPEQICRQKYPQANIDQTQLCAGGEAGKDACRGDSGGPLMYPGRRGYQEVMILAGLVSFGKKCGIQGVPGVYTRVGQYMDWIVGNLEP